MDLLKTMMDDNNNNLTLIPTDKNEDLLQTYEEIWSKFKCLIKA